MDQDWLERLYNMTLEADNNGIVKLLTEIPSHYNYLAKHLHKLLQTFQYEKILDLVEPLINV